jgi:predicted AAA+ superfamily ATPase
MLRRVYDLTDYVKPGQVLVIFGARQVGKTTLVRSYLETTKLKYRFVFGDDVRAQSALGSPDVQVLKEYVVGYELLVIDEAQKIPRIGDSLKLLVDAIPALHIIVTGSASFELAGQIGEPLTGRKRTITLHPMSQLELAHVFNRQELRERVEEYLRFGTYPKVVTAEDMPAKRVALEEITGSYMLKDILELERVKGSKILLDLLRLIAFQIGNEVSLSELGASLGIDYKTVARYLDLFEKTFILHNLRGYSRNLRKEVTKKSKYYFCDIGVRNAIIGNFAPLSERNDVGQLWENFLMMERLKMRAYTELWANSFFWRTWDQQEIDLVEERDGKLFGYEFKWGAGRVREPRTWRETYPEATFEVITPENYLDFINPIAKNS